MAVSNGKCLAAIQIIHTVILFEFYVGSSPIVVIFLYVAKALERVLAVAFGNKLRWLESHFRHISLCSQGT